jgi:hypothetical protein
MAFVRAQANSKDWDIFRRLAEGEKPAEIAKELDITLNAVYLAKSRSIKILRAQQAAE